MTQDQVKLNDAIQLICSAIGFIDEIKYELNYDIRKIKCDEIKEYLNLGIDELLSGCDSLPPGKE